MSPELPSSLMQQTPWNEEPGAIWIGSSIILRRNLAGRNFPNKQSAPEKEQVINDLKNELENTRFYKQSELSAANRDLIYEHFLFLQGFSEAPDGSGVAIDENGDLLALFNLGDHLQIRALNFTSNWESTWNALASIEDKIDKAKGFAFSPKFGYLTSNPDHCGTGLTIYAYLHLPGLIHNNKLQETLGGNEEVTFMGLSGDLNDLIGDIIVVQNNYSIGMSEEAILHSVQNTVTKLTGAEKAIRSQETNTEIKDLISKAFGLLVHSYQLEIKEALDLLSLMKLGLALGEIADVSDRILSELFFKCRRGHLLNLFPDLKENEEIAKKRATYLQEQLTGIRLTSEC
ncbi:MAG: hypothetical protein P0S96_07625 [Simkaniaceae bacterium]|nr:hypothetical protein [Candidatus Sacchlamyda saccharinae]